MTEVMRAHWHDLHVDNRLDYADNPAGGTVTAWTTHQAPDERVDVALLEEQMPVLWIRWQDGPLGQGDQRSDPNGASIEDVLIAARQRLEWFQSPDTGKGCAENAQAIDLINAALAQLERRTDRRTRLGLEGTQEGS